LMSLKPPLLSQERRPLQCLERLRPAAHCPLTLPSLPEAGERGVERSTEIAVRRFWPYWRLRAAGMERPLGRVQSANHLCVSLHLLAPRLRPPWTKNRPETPRDASVS